MSPTLDSAILKALNLDAATTTIASHGGSGFSSTAKLTSKVLENNKDGKDVETEKTYFVKIGKGKESEIMFAGEHASLNALHNSVPNFCPQSYAYGPLSDTSGSFLATDFLDLRSMSSSKGSGISMAAKLAKLHSTPAPIPEGYSKPMFGFPVTTCCGKTEQPNTWTDNWADFYAEHRLKAILRKCEDGNGEDVELDSMVRKTANVVVPRLLATEHLNGGKGIVPVVVHGDLWSGNHGKGIIGGNGGVEDVVFDPSSCYAHSEFDFGIMGMFGGFGASFWKEYHGIKPKDEPVEEYDDRVQLYELYHHLNHYAMFGSSYRSGAMSIMKKLNRKYGKD